MTDSSSINPSLTIAVRPAGDVGVFEISVRNNGAMTIWDLRFATYELLGPGDFGLDDTHMPVSLRQEEEAQIRCIEPESSACIVRKKWGSLSQYNGQSTGTHRVTFSLKEDGAARFGMMALFVVFDADGLPFGPDLSRRRPGDDRWSFRSGQAVSRFFRRLVSKTRLS